MKKLLFVSLILFLCFACFASDSENSYSLNIKNADMVRVKGSYILLSGNVNVDFKTDSGEQYKLSSQRVQIDTDNNTLDASGDVVLTKGDESEAFRGEVVSLNWKNLDIKVFDGKSRSERQNATKTKVNFYSQGESISYAGSGDTVLFENGIVSTKDGNTNWSINAKQIELLGNDLFFRNATLRIGRVPIFWFPIFYYPGSRLGFNPAVGVTNEGNSFINTTTELYGTYQMSAAATSVQENDTDAIAGNVMSLLKKDDKTVLVREGLLYREYNEKDTLPPVQNWAKKTGSHFVITADAYSEKGFAFGFDTKNTFFDGKIKLSASGMAAYNTKPSIKTYKNENISLQEKPFMFATDLSMDVKLKNVNLSLSVPYLTNPNIKSLYYNRINTFSLDSVFGTKQTLPSSYKSAVNSYTMSLNANTSKRIGSYNFNLSSLKANINYVYNDSLKDDKLVGFEINSMSLPTLSFSSNGVFFDKKTETVSKTVTKDFNTRQAKELDKEFNELQEGSSEKPKDLIAPPDTGLSKTSQVSGGQARMNYNLYYNLDNYYVKNTNKTTDTDEDYLGTFSSKLNGSVMFYAKAPGNWLTINDTFTPTYNFSVSRDETRTHSSAFSNTITIAIPQAGLSYSLAQKLYSNTITIKKDKENREITRTENPFYGKFDANSITSNSLSFRKTFGFLTVGVSSTLKPLTETFKPNISISKFGFTISGDYSEKRPLGEKEFTKDKANFNLSFSKKFFSSYINNTYDFTKEGWDGYYNSAKVNFNFSKINFSTYATINMEKKFEAKRLETGIGFKGGSAVLTFKDKDYKAEKFRFNYSYSIPAKYFWKNRIGLESKMSTSFNYDFENPYATSLSFNFTLGLAVNKFLDLNLSVVSSNNSFYRYYEGNKFMVGEMFSDLLRSFDIITGGNRRTSFNLSSFTLSLVHYMEDWNLYIDGTGNVVKDEYNAYYFDPQFKVYIKWNIIPEIKVEDTYAYDNNYDGFMWEKIR